MKELKNLLILFYLVKSKFIFIILFLLYRNYIINEKDSIQNLIKNFSDFKNKFLKQKKVKFEDLKKLFLSGKIEFDKNELKEDNKNKIVKKEKNDEIIEI